MNLLKKWGIRSLIAVGLALGLCVLFAAVLQYPVVGQAIGSPAACGTCHVMAHEVETLATSPHSETACLDCHSAIGFVAKPVDEVKTAARHAYVFMTNKTPDIIKPDHHALKIVQDNCVRCHADTLGNTHIDRTGTTGYCFECHRNTTHSTPVRN